MMFEKILPTIKNTQLQNSSREIYPRTKSVHNENKRIDQNRLSMYNKKIFEFDLMPNDFFNFDTNSSSFDSERSKIPIIIQKIDFSFPKNQTQILKEKIACSKEKLIESIEFIQDLNEKYDKIIKEIEKENLYVEILYNKIKRIKQMIK